MFQSICDPDNLILADKKARKRKKGQYGIIMFDKNRDENLKALRGMLISISSLDSAFAE